MITYYKHTKVVIITYHNHRHATHIQRVAMMTSYKHATISTSRRRAFRESHITNILQIWSSHITNMLNMYNALRLSHGTDTLHVRLPHNPPTKLFGSGVSTPCTLFCQLICAIKSELSYFPIFTDSIEPGSISAGIRWTGSIPAGFIITYSDMLQLRSWHVTDVLRTYRQATNIQRARICTHLHAYMYADIRA